MSLILKPIPFKNNAKPSSDPKISSIGPSILCKQKGSETKSGLPIYTVTLLKKMKYEFIMPIMRKYSFNNNKIYGGPTG